MSFVVSGYGNQPMDQIRSADQNNMPGTKPLGGASKLLSPLGAGLAQKVTHTALDVIADIKTPGFIKHVKHLFKKSPQINAQAKGKHAEHMAVFNGFKTRLETTSGKIDLGHKTLIDRNTSDLKDPKIVQSKIERQIMQRYKAKGVEVNEDVKNNLAGASTWLAKHFCAGNKIGGGELEGTFQSFSLPSLSNSDLKKLAQTFSKEIVAGNPGELEAHAANLSNHVERLKVLLSRVPGEKDHELESLIKELDPKVAAKVQRFRKATGQNVELKDVGKLNKEIMQVMRSALESPAYLALKENENNPSVRILHDLAVAGYLETIVMPGYEELHKDYSQGGPEMPEKMKGKEIVSFFQKFRQHIHKNGIHKADMTNPFYLLTNFNSARQAFKSQKVGRGYDPRINAENNAGAFFDEKARVGPKTANLRHFFTPSWRVDSDIPPEARAVLQSMTNRQNMKVEHDDHVAKQILYNNLQNINKSDESPSSINMMKLNDEFPDAFKGVTIPCDTSFHNRGLGHGSKMWDNLYPDEGAERPTTMENFQGHLFQKLMSPENFTLEGRIGGTGGYYLPGGQAKWREPLGEICAHLGDKYKELQNESPFKEIAAKIQSGQGLTEDEKIQRGLSLNNDEKIEWWHLESAMIEEANIAIRTLNEGMGLVDLQKAGQPLNQAMTTVCKELADRGKNGSLENLFATSETDGLEGDTLKAFSAAKEDRPTLARNRVGLAHRDAAGNALFMLRLPKDLQETKNLALKLAMKAGGLDVNASVIPGATIVKSPGLPK